MPDEDNRGNDNSKGDSDDHQKEDQNGETKDNEGGGDLEEGDEGGEEDEEDEEDEGDEIVKDKEEKIMNHEQSKVRVIYPPHDNNQAIPISTSTLKLSVRSS